MSIPVPSYKNSKTKRRQKLLTFDLKPNSRNLPVTAANRLEYIHLLARFRLLTQPRQQTDAFLKGLSSIISPKWLSMFNQAELQTLIGGNDFPINIHDLRENTIYSGAYTVGDDGQDHPTIKLFWKVMLDLSEEDRRAVLKY